MTDKGLTADPQDTDSSGDGQDTPALQVNITNRDKKQRIRRALRLFGFPKIGTGVTQVLVAFADDDRVQAAVRRYLGGTAPTPIEER